MVFFFLMVVAVKERDWLWYKIGVFVAILMLIIRALLMYDTWEYILANWLIYLILIAVFGAVMYAKTNPKKNKTEPNTTPEGTDSFDKVASWYKPGLEQKTDKENENKEQQ